MENEIIFTETQRFKQVWLWIVLAAVTFVVPASSIFGVVKQLVYGQQLGTKPITSGGFVVIIVFTILIPLLLLVLFSLLKLETVFKKVGIYVRFVPFQVKYKFYAWGGMSHCFVRQYHAISEFGGWGLRGFGKNRAFNVSGNSGIQIVTKDGYRALIGTIKPEEATNALKLIGQWKEE